MSQLRFKNNHVSVPMSHSCGTWRLHAEVYVGYLFVIMMLLGPACGWDFFNSLLSQKSRTPPLQCIAWLTMTCTLEKCKILSSLQLTGGWNVYLPQNGDDHRKPLIFGKDGYGKPLICRSCSCEVHHELVPFPFCQKLLIQTYTNSMFFQVSFRGPLAAAKAAAPVQLPGFVSWIPVKSSLLWPMEVKDQKIVIFHGTNVVPSTRNHSQFCRNGRALTIQFLEFTFGLPH